MKVRITGYELQPLEEGEELGMPTYRVSGTIRDKPHHLTKPFCIDISCEIDGRDCDFVHVSGHRLGNDGEYFVFDTLCKDEGWIKLHNEKAEEYYAQYA